MPNAERVRKRRFIGRVYRALGPLLAALALTGCSSHRPATDTGAVAPGFALAASELAHPGPRRETREIRDPDTGDLIGTAVHETTAPEADGSWTAIETDAGQTPRQSHYRFDADGSVLLEWTRSIKDTDPEGPPRLYVFEPPLRLWPTRLEPGIAFDDSTRMTERSPKDESRVVLSGTARRHVELAGPSPEDPPGAVRALADMRISVGPAEATHISTLVYDPGRGVRSELVDYSIRVLGLRFKHVRKVTVPVDREQVH
ncbi:MAG: hypothetical protein H6810_07710 [Phycisphaeraceae bacterium]|nr:MAG: hypothetical protein H6810_07710 [Phycisphaeraceae bacterium]